MLQILYMGVVLYAPAIALNQGMYVSYSNHTLSLFIEFGEPNASIACRLGRCSQQHNFILFRVFCIVFYRVCLCLAEHERECNSVIIHEH